jgi:hypothetical protein
MRPSRLPMTASLAGASLASPVNGIVDLIVCCLLKPDEAPISCWDRGYKLIELAMRGLLISRLGVLDGEDKNESDYLYHSGNDRDCRRRETSKESYHQREDAGDRQRDCDPRL